MRVLATAEAGFVRVAATSVAKATSIWTFKTSSKPQSLRSKASRVLKLALLTPVLVGQLNVEQP